MPSSAARQVAWSPRSGSRESNYPLARIAEQGATLPQATPHTRLRRGVYGEYYSDTVADFEEDAGLRRLMVDHVNDKEANLNSFLLALTHHCCSVPFQAPPDDLTGIKCADIFTNLTLDHKTAGSTRSANFPEQNYSRFSPTNCVEGPGFFLIKNIDYWSQATTKFI